MAPVSDLRPGNAFLVKFSEAIGCEACKFHHCFKSDAEVRHDCASHERRERNLDHHAEQILKHYSLAEADSWSGLAARRYFMSGK